MANRDAQNPGTRIPSGTGVVHVLPNDDEGAARIVAPLVERVGDTATTPELIVLTADPESAVAIARAVAPDGVTRLVPLTSERRAARLLAERRGAGAVAATPEVVLALVRRGALKLDGVRTVVLAWADDILALGEGAALESVMAEFPKDGGRVVLTSTLSEPVEDILERYLRRAHRVGVAPPAADLPPLPLAYLVVAPAARADALRRLLDDLDPSRSVVFARTERGLAEARHAVRELGYRDDGAAVAITSGPVDRDASLVVLYELPAGGADLRAIAGSGSRSVVALVRPRDVARLRAMAGAPITPYTSREGMDRARRRGELARAELRAELERGTSHRELLSLEPLLREFDGIEVAAAALRLRERDRERADEGPATPSPTPARAHGWTRLFLTAGTRDNVRAGDLVGMIAAEGGITSDQIGRIDLRENHSLVEVAADVADRVAARINGAQVKGRRIVARPERDRAERAREDRGARGGGRGGRGAAGESRHHDPRPRRTARIARSSGNNEGEPPPSRA